MFLTYEWHVIQYRKNVVLVVIEYSKPSIKYEMHDIVLYKMHCFYPVVLHESIGHKMDISVYIIIINIVFTYL